jgi:prevent-host-death family protein
MVMKVATQSETRTISAAEFKAKCLQLIDDVDDENSEIVVTKRGVPKAKLIPFKQPEEPAFVSVVGRSPNVKILGDIMTPLDWPDPSDKWIRAMNQDNAKKKKRK